MGVEVIAALVTAAVVLAAAEAAAAAAADFLAASSFSSGLDGGVIWLVLGSRPAAAAGFGTWGS